MKLIIVDDNYLFREDLKLFLVKRLHHTVIAEAASGEEFLKLENKMEADIILMDINLGKVDGFKATKKVLEDFSHFKIIALTMGIENALLLIIIEAGFKGFVYKSNLFNTLETAIQQVYSGQLVFPKELIEKYGL
jgi:DNA-binding NarL/FixJ family response regulator